MVDVLDLSARIIDSGLDFDPVSRMTQEVSEVADRVALVESLSHSVALRTGAGLVVFDASGQWSGQAVVQALGAGQPILSTRSSTPTGIWTTWAARARSWTTLPGTVPGGRVSWPRRMSVPALRGTA